MVGMGCVGWVVCGYEWPWGMSQRGGIFHTRAGCPCHFLCYMDRIPVLLPILHGQDARATFRTRSGSSFVDQGGHSGFVLDGDGQSIGQEGVCIVRL